jgi:transposase
MIYAVKVIYKILTESINKRQAKQIIFVLLLAFGVNKKEITEKAGAGLTSLYKYEKLIEEEKLNEIFEAELYRPVSELEKYASEIEEELERHPPKTRAEAQERIRRVTGITRALPNIGRFLKKRG